MPPTNVQQPTNQENPPPQAPSSQESQSSGEQQSGSPPPPPNGQNNLPKTMAQNETKPSEMQELAKAIAEAVTPVDAEYGIDNEGKSTLSSTRKINE